MSPSHRKRLVESLATWNFKPHELDDGDLFRVATLLFEAVIGSEGLAELGIEQGKPTSKRLREKTKCSHR
jgi:hypothetical protein